MNARRSLRRTVARGFSLVFLCVSAMLSAEGVVITNYLAHPWLQFSTAVNAGDVIVWVNRLPLPWGATYVQSYGGEWRSPVLNQGDSFVFTFTNAGFYSYRAPSLYYTNFGTVTVGALTGAPPAVMINIPVQDSLISWNGGLVQASVSNANNIVEVDYFANGTPIGVATNAAYGIYWNGGQAGSVTLLAKAIDGQGGITWSLPVKVTGAPSIAGAWGPRLLLTGEMLFHYNAADGGTYFTLQYSDDPSFSTNVCMGAVDSPGVFVDETVRGGTVPRRFYRVY